MMRFNSFNFGSIFGYGGGNSLYSNISMLRSIRSGAYSKAVRAQNARSDQTAAAKKNTAVNKYSYGMYGQEYGLSAISKESGELSAAARKLTGAGKDGLFSSKENYDPDAAYKAASDFVTNYNETIDAVNKTSNTSVSAAASNMRRMTGVMKGSLGKIGITVGKDGKLSINEDDFKAAGFDNVKSMLGASGSFARTIDSYAQRIDTAAEQQSRLASLGNAGTYGRYGSYLGGFGYGGSYFDGFF